MKALLSLFVALVLTRGTLGASAEVKLPDMKKQPSAQTAPDECIDTLNKCDLN